jgi:predicted HTH domain antitoxin
MKTYTIHVPDNIQLDDYELNMIIASKLFETGKLSAGQAAEMVGISKRSFVESLSDYGVSMFNHDEIELDEDIKNA